MNSSRPLKIGIVGFGNFGQFLAKTFVKQGHKVIGTSRSSYEAEAKSIGALYVPKATDMLDHEPDVVLFCTSITSTRSVIEAFPIDALRGKLVVDVLSVKAYPKKLLLELLPPGVDILCTHPMFGPESGRHSWKSLPFVYEQVRISDTIRCETFLGIFSSALCTMIPMSCELHDSYAASSQFITHTTGRMLAKLNLVSTPINTKGYESLLGVVETTCKDSFDLYYGLYKYNPNAKLELEKLEQALQALRKELETREALEAWKKD
ncbi:hypothetical protein GpartN1_g879.t1 [Galdieria partita]|uniref:Prephenate/arogenate dehydrogenase domain-containing protein n=1 Tax=Galdieria partita TaxID=83374 RepID=A0A9C7PR27_9RHOD|nr:hypothetical protein GpartN1_g879.t1 [Galdieria partita]